MPKNFTSLNDTYSQHIDDFNDLVNKVGNVDDLRYLDSDIVTAVNNITAVDSADVILLIDGRIDSTDFVDLTSTQTISGAKKFTTDVQVDNSRLFFNSAGFLSWRLENDSSNFKISKVTGTKLFIDSDGNFGINTETPTVTFHISATDAIQMPTGTIAQRPSDSSDGRIRYNNEDSAFEGFSRGLWRQFPQVAYGLFYENNQNVSNNYTIPSTKNAMTVGPISIDSGVTVSIDSGGSWSIV